MKALNKSTHRRLKQLPQTPSVWEGDRRPLASGMMRSMDSSEDGGGPRDCILWVDGTQGAVRAMDVVTTDIGHEAVARTLLRAIEYPHNPCQPARPKKIVVKDREIQFFLRGVLQELGITIDYVPELPLIDEIFRGFEEIRGSRPPQLPESYEQSLVEVSQQLWEDAPWDVLEEHQIIAIELNQWDVGTLYVSIMGMLGMEYGILLYRSLDSLKQFRQKVLADRSFEEMEEAFLQQDCLFLNYEASPEYLAEAQAEGFDLEDIDLEELEAEEVYPSFGNLHPLEGLRPVLHEEEALVALAALQALHRFFEDYEEQFEEAEISTRLERRYRLAVSEGGKSKRVAATVSYQPELANELLEMVDTLASPSEDGLPLSMVVPPLQSLRDDLIPDDSFLSLGAVPWEVVELLRVDVKHHQAGKGAKKADELPVILIQTTRPKAHTVIQSIQKAGGLQGIGFNPGENPLERESYDLGILKTKDGDLHLFGEFEENDPVHVAAKRKWDQRCKKTKGYCGLVIAMGLTGMSRGNPQLKDMMALFEVQALSSQDLGIGKLQLMPQMY